MEIDKEFINDIYNAEKQQSLLFFIGAGVSISQGYPDWNKYVDELIQFWKVNLINITNDERTFYPKVYRNDYIILDILLKSKLSNKRKVDLVNHMIKKYSKAINSKESDKIYNQYVLSFEKFFFQDMPPLNPDNGILREITKLKANFITTNYDANIEQNLKSQEEKNINISNNYSEIPSNLIYPSVIHIHGTPNSNPEYFISSASSYNFMYLEENSYIDLMRTLFKKEKSYTMVFIGCSLEEEEIMNLLSKKVKNIKLYALMKRDDNEDFNQFIRDYYSKKYDINIIWYGKNYNELPLFLEEFVNEIQQKKNLYSYEKVYEALITEDDGSRTIINNVIDNGDYSKLNKSIKEVLSANTEIQKKAINNLMKLKPFPVDVLKNEIELFNLWSLIANQYKEMNEKTIEEIISIGKSLKRFNYNILEALIRIVEKKVENLKQKEQINYIEENLNIYLNNRWFIQSNNKYINLLWIINGIDNSRRNIEDITKVKKILVDDLKITDELGNRIIKKLQKNNLSLEIKSYEELILDPGINAIVSLWEKNNLSFGKRISNKLISFPFVQKIVIHRIEENNIENEELIKKLVINIDREYLFYDIKVKNFIDKYSKEYNLENKLKNCSESHFKNEIIFTEAFWIEDKPFYPIDLAGFKYHEIEEKLLEATKQKPYFNGKNHFNLEGQNIELFNSFKNSKCSSNEKKEFFSKLIKNKELSKSYFKAIYKIVVFGLTQKIFTLKDIDTFIEVNIKEKILIDINNNIFDLLERLIKEFKINTDKIFELLMTVDLSKSDELNVKNQENIVDLTRFINSKIGKYFNIVSLCQVKNCNNKSRVKEKIKETNIIKYYLIGQFINFYEILDLPDNKIDIFIGFSHNYILYNNSKYIDFFELSAKQIFENNIYDDFLRNNLTLILLKKVNPISNINIDKVEKEKAKIIFQIMIDIYLKDQEYIQFKNWLEYFVENLELTTTLINKLISNIHMRKFEKLNILLEMFKRLKLSERIKFSQISYVYKINNFDEKCLIFYYNVLLTLKNSNMLIFDTEGIMYIEYLLKEINNIASKELTSKFVNLIKEEIPKAELDKYIK